MSELYKLRQECNYLKKTMDYSEYKEFRDEELRYLMSTYERICQRSGWEPIVSGWILMASKIIDLKSYFIRNLESPVKAEELNKHMLSELGQLVSDYHLSEGSEHLLVFKKKTYGPGFELAISNEIKLLVNGGTRVKESTLSFSIDGREEVREEFRTILTDLEDLIQEIN